MVRSEVHDHTSVTKNSKARGFIFFSFKVEIYFVESVHANTLKRKPISVTTSMPFQGWGGGRGRSRGMGMTITHHVWSVLSSLGSHGCPFAGNSLEAGFDALYGTSTAARPTFKEVKASVFIQFGLSPLARVAHDVFPWKDKKSVAFKNQIFKSSTLCHLVVIFRRHSYV